MIDAESIAIRLQVAAWKNRFDDRVTKRLRKKVQKNDENLSSNPVGWLRHAALAVIALGIAEAIVAAGERQDHVAGHDPARRQLG